MIRSQAAITALSMFETQDKQELDFCYEGGEKDAIWIAKTLAPEFKRYQKHCEELEAEILRLKPSPPRDPRLICEQDDPF